MRARLSIAAVVCASLLAAPFASADTDTSAAAHKAASDRYHHGIELYKKASQTHDPADFERAYLEFAQAYSIYPDDKVLWNLGASELETKRFVSALRHFRTYDAHLHVSDDPKHPDHAKLATYLDRSYAATGHLDIKAPAGAKITVDGTAAGVAPLADIVDVESGTHQVSSDAESRSVDAADGQVVKVVFAAAATGAAAGPIATTPATPLTPVAQTNKSTSTPEAPSGGPPVASWILAGVGVVGLGVGIGFAFDGSSQNSKVASAGAACADTSSSECSAIHDADSARSRDRVIAIAGIAGGGASIVAAGVIWYVVSKRRSHEASASGAWLAPSVGPGHAGFALGSSF